MLNDSSSMTQQQNATSSNRNCWKSARERERLRARFEIRERVSAGVSVVAEQNEELDVELTKTFLRQVSDGSVASFSLSTLLKHVSLYTRPIPSSLLSEYKITTLCTSRFGKEHADKVLAFRIARATCTMMEYASLLGEYKIIGSLLLGGIDPTVSGDLVDKSLEPLVSKGLSVRVLHRFFDCFPHSLKTYIVKRVVDMRLRGWIQGCGSLCFGEPCLHHFSEESFWNDLLDNVDERAVGDVVRCPVCGESTPSKNPKDDQDTNECASPQDRCQQSLDRYLSLPCNTTELKSRSMTKAPKKLILASSWADAVAQSLGNSRDVRRDKIFTFVESGAIHYVRGCLNRGIDINMVNEYGQTALYLAAWKGYQDVVDLLLQFGANPSVLANGGSTALSVAKANNQDEIVSILSFLGVEETLQESSLQDELECPNSRLEVLIPVDADHPGAGSFTIDDALAERHLDALVDLRMTLPLALSDKKKKKNIELCSDRFYFSDAHGWVRQLLETAIKRILSSAIVLPHMRFLHYEHAGSVLAPHIDLCRVHADSGQRSTHTFILYLDSCNSGGETMLLKSITSSETLAEIAPTRGRLLLFPHSCPHMGAEVVDVPKLLLRGEVILAPTSTSDP
jgi:hypothetical protein